MATLLFLQNSIRHNLSLHDMFVRETSGNGKVSFWTIHPSANRYLTLDQVFKVSVLVSSGGAQRGTPSSPTLKQGGSLGAPPPPGWAGCQLPSLVPLGYDTSH